METEGLERRGDGYPGFEGYRGFVEVEWPRFTSREGESLNGIMGEGNDEGKGDRGSGSS